MLVDVSFRQPGRDGKCGVIDFSIITPAAESYCAEAEKKPLYASKMREDAKVIKYFQAYKNMDILDNLRVLPHYQVFPSVQEHGRHTF